MERYVLAIGGNIAKHPDGGWVKYEDAARLADEIKQLRTKNKRLGVGINSAINNYALREDSEPDKPLLPYYAQPVFVKDLMQLLEGGGE